jgi:hypothetical protein
VLALPCDDEDEDIAATTIAVSTSGNTAGVRSMKLDHHILKRAPLLIGQSHFDTLRGWIKVIAPSRRDCIVQIVSLYPLIGVRQSTVTLILEFLEEYRSGCINHTKMPLRLQEVKYHDSRAYTILQISMELIREAMRVRLIGYVPPHTMKAQFDAHRKSLAGLPPEADIVVYDSFEFVYCTACDSVYCMLRDHKSSYKKCYDHGYRDASKFTFTDTHNAQLLTVVLCYFSMQL